MTHTPLSPPPPSCCPLRRGRTPATNNRFLFIHRPCLKLLPCWVPGHPHPAASGQAQLLCPAPLPDLGSQRGRAWRALVPWGKGALFVCDHSQGAVTTWEHRGLALMGVFSHSPPPLGIQSGPVLFQHQSQKTLSEFKGREKAHESSQQTPGASARTVSGSTTKLCDLT